MTSPFKQPTGSGGAYLKLEEFEDTLILFRPESIDKVPAYKPEQPPVDEVTGHWVAFGPNGEEVRDGAKFKGGSLVRAARDAMKNRDFPWVLGVLAKVPTKDTAKDYEIEYDPAEYKRVRDEWFRSAGKSGPEPKFAWTLTEFSPEQAAQAAKYVEKYTASANPFTGGAAS